MWLLRPFFLIGFVGLAAALSTAVGAAPGDHGGGRC
jgi:hypothetical protein